MQADLQEFLAEMGDLATAPALLPKLQQMLDRDDTSLEELQMVLRMDPALTSLVLRMANSSFYSTGEALVSLEEAISILGFRQVHRIATSLAFHHLLNQPLPAFQMDRNHLWHRSVACALAMQATCRRYGEDAHAGYLIGLLHGLGMVFINHHLVLQKSLPTQELAEEEVVCFGFHYAEIGAVILETWKFPASVTEVIRWQFEPASAGATKSMTQFLWRAKLMARFFQALPPIREQLLGQMMETLPSLQDPGGLEWLKDLESQYREQIHLCNLPA